MKWQIHIIMDLCSALADKLPGLKTQLLAILRRGFASSSLVLLAAVAHAALTWCHALLLGAQQHAPPTAGGPGVGLALITHCSHDCRGAETSSCPG